MYETSKRVLDIAAAIVVLVIFSPIFIITPILIKLDSPGPVFYKQRRVGRHGKEFFIYKFRNMYTNADEMVMNDPVFRKLFKKKTGWKLDIDKDPRITRVGHYLRKYSLDELPQIFNILNGEMSMVGPRAYRRDGVGDEIEEQLKNYPHLRSKMKLVLSVKPGLTGPWQTSGRNQLDWDERVRLDADYASRRSLAYDIWILIKTPRAMLSKW